MEEQEQTQKNSRTVLQENAKNAEKSQIGLKVSQVLSKSPEVSFTYSAATMLLSSLYPTFIAISSDYEFKISSVMMCIKCTHCCSVHNQDSLLLRPVVPKLCLKCLRINMAHARFSYSLPKLPNKTLVFHLH